VNGTPEAVIDGIPAFAPDLAYSAEGFDPDAFDALAALEPRSFWFRSRNELLKWAARRYFPTARSIHEIGCGTGFVLSGLRDVYPDAELSGSEILVSGLVHARRRMPGMRFMQMDARRIPFRSAFDLIGAFDVLEHIDDDSQVLREIHSALRPRGGLLITVPQHTWLWSGQDDLARHQRRYSRHELIDKLERAGFDILRATSFVSLLLPMMFVTRRLADRRPRESGTETLSLPDGLDAMLRPVLALERSFIRRGLSFGVGGSLLVAASRREDLVG
jgi:SAM-dependent methyltransferase